MAEDLHEPSPLAAALRRARWRTRGNTAAPAFVLCVVVDAVLLGVLPFAGDGMGFVPAVLVAGFFNLAMVAVLAPAVAFRLRRRREDLPLFIARDKAATALMLGLVGVLVAAGLAHRPQVRDREDARQAQAEAVRRYVAAQAPERFRGNVGRADTVQLSDSFFRTCVPGPDPRRALCLFVDTAQTPPGVRVDDDQRPNAVVSGPLNPGRRGA